jgi:hypothetical protein
MGNSIDAKEATYLKDMWQCRGSRYILPHAEVHSHKAIHIPRPFIKRKLFMRLPRFWGHTNCILAKSESIVGILSPRYSLYSIYALSKYLSKSLQLAPPITSMWRLGLLISRRAIIVAPKPSASSPIKSRGNRKAALPRSTNLPVYFRGN